MLYKDKNKEIKFISERRRRYKKKLIEIKGGKCQICGYSNCVAALEFHHIDEVKRAKISYIYNRGWDRILKEVEKTILVCANCHREIHKNLIDLNKLVPIAQRWSN